MKKVAFICYGNACRSQMAEGLSRKYGDGLYQAYSAGTNPLGRVPSEVYEVMKKRGIDISDQYSKGLGDIPLDDMDFVITMGNCSASSICPAHFAGDKIDWYIPDPYGETMTDFEHVCRIIEERIKEFIRIYF
ncbi:MAG: arsenate reductase ArsC [Nitrospinota bacterium]